VIIKDETPKFKMSVGRVWLINHTNNKRYYFIQHITDYQKFSSMQNFREAYDVNYKIE
jgi:hypothetical protein